MRIIFLGTPEFAAYSLKQLHEAGKEVIAVITAPDRKAGRGQQIHESAVKKFAISAGIDVLQPKNLKDPDFLDSLRSYKADLQIVVAFRMLPEAVWNMPPKGTMNLHASLLPAYRGAAPINWAVINGEKESGITTFFLKHEIDTGAILKRKKVELDARETAGSLHDKLMKKGAELILESISTIEKGNYVLKEQSQFMESGQQVEDLPKAPKIYREDCKINWNQAAEQVDRLIRGLSPYPAAWSSMKKRDGRTFNLKIYFSTPSNIKVNAAAGSIERRDDRIYVACKDNLLEIEELQLEGKKRMKVINFLNGINLEDYEVQLS